MTAAATAITVTSGISHVQELPERVGRLDSDWDSSLIVVYDLDAKISESTAAIAVADRLQRSLLGAIAEVDT